MSAKTPLGYPKKCFSKNQNPTEKRKKTFFEKTKKYQNPISIPPKKDIYAKKNTVDIYFVDFLLWKDENQSQMKLNEMK